MHRGFSLYLDLVRFVAACLVYIYHSNQRALVADILPASNFGHSAVIVFFVLSGFVIAYVTDTKEKHWTDYAASRISRIYSVALPAVFLTVLLDGIGRQLYPALYAYPFDQFLIRIAASLLISNEVWFVSITSFSNVPYWSICYEMWYYVAFGLLVFFPLRVGLALTALLALLLGPKMLLLAPVWGAGVLLQRWGALQRMPQTLAWVLAGVSVIGIVLFHWAGVEPWVTARMKAWLGPELHTNLTFSKFFLSDYLLTALVFLNFASMRCLGPQLALALGWLESPIRTLAAYTLTLYLLHQPLFLFWAAVLRGDPGGHGYWSAVTALVALSVFVIGHFTESRRHTLKHVLQRVFEALDARWRSPALAR
jgi:peptidoglycan/LPS O-acetylase OafA/YrhL